MDTLCKPNPPQREGLEDMPFTNPIRHKMVRGAPACLKCFVVAFSLVPDLRVEDSAVMLDELNALSLIEPLSIRGQVATLNCQRERNHSYHNGQHRQSNVYNGLTHNGQHRQSAFYGGMTHMNL